MALVLRAVKLNMSKLIATFMLMFLLIYAYALLVRARA